MTGRPYRDFPCSATLKPRALVGRSKVPWFQKNFKGKKILNSQDEFVSIGIAKGKAGNLPKDKQENYVDGISGATLTGRYLSEGIKNTLMKYGGRIRHLPAETIED